MTGRYPRLRFHSPKRKNVKVVVYCIYDRRPAGLSDVGLGTDFDEAVRKRDELHNHTARIVGTLEETFAGWETDVMPEYTSVETRTGECHPGTVSCRRVTQARGVPSDREFHMPRA
ncbi:MAG: hypothetical protein ACRYGA_09980 [Janthinobacterium lividum]